MNNTIKSFMDQYWNSSYVMILIIVFEVLFCPVVINYISCKKLDYFSICFCDLIYFMFKILKLTGLHICKKLNSF